MRQRCGLATTTTAHAAMRYVENDELRRAPPAGSRTEPAPRRPASGPGSLVPAGGHNPLEPAQFGVAITTGPHFENFRAVVELLVESNAMTIVKPSELAPILAALLVSERENADAGRNAKNIYERESGASVRSAQAIVALLRSSGAKGSAGSGIA